MSRHDLVAIVHGTPDLGTMPEVIGNTLHGFTVVCHADPAPTIRLPQDRRTLLKRAAHRQKICEALMQSGTVLPALPQQPVSLSQITDLILANLPALQNWTAKYARLVQYQVTVTWDEPKVLGYFRTAPEITPLYARQSVTAEQIGRAVHDLADRLAQQMAQSLTTVALETQTLPDTGNGLINMVLLMPETAEPILDEAVTTIDAIWTEGLQIRQIGPGPAGSFLSLAARQVTREDVEAAKSLLGLKLINRDDISRSAKALLRKADAHNAHDIRDAACILEAAGRLGRPETGFVLLEPWAEGTSQASNMARRVA